MSCYVILSNIYSYPNHFFEIPIRNELQTDNIINGADIFMRENIHNEVYIYYII